jgi:hypothetical protein
MKAKALGTKSVPWVVWSAPTSAACAIKLSHLTSGGGYSRRATLGARTVDKVLGQLVNTVAIAPWVENTTSALNAKFRVDVFRGVNNNLDEVCLVSCVTDAYRLSCRADGTPLAVSSFYCDGFNVTEKGYTVIEYTPANGKGHIEFDLKGATDMAINLVSTLAAGDKIGFEVTGW